MTTTDPVLKQLVADAYAAEESIPLTLYLSSGRLYGHVTSHEDFCNWATGQLGQQSGFTGTIALSPDLDYVHLIVQPLSMPGEQSSVEVVRARLTDVVAWTI